LSKLRALKDNDIKSATADEGFLSADELLKRLPISRGTLHNYIKAGKIPCVKLNHRLMFFWPNVRDALLRQQREAA
jgi:predicted site-specific integrase-resolvase